MDDVYCNGTEKLLDQCSFIRTPNCNHWEDVIVTCSFSNQTTSQSSYRLANPVNITFNSPMGYNSNNNTNYGVWGRVEKYNSTL